MSKKSTKSDLKRLDAMKDEEIDYSEIPEFDEAFLREVEMKVSPRKKPVSLRLDADVPGVDARPGQGLPEPD